MKSWVPLSNEPGVTASFVSCRTLLFAGWFKADSATIHTQGYHLHKREVLCCLLWMRYCKNAWERLGTVLTCKEKVCPLFSCIWAVALTPSSLQWVLKLLFKYTWTMNYVHSMYNLKWLKINLEPFTTMHTWLLLCCFRTLDWNKGLNIFRQCVHCLCLHVVAVQLKWSLKANIKLRWQVNVQASVLLKI